MATSKTADILERDDAPIRSAPHRGRFASFVQRSPKLHLVVIVALLATTLGAVAWRAIAIDRLEGELAATRQQADVARGAQAGELLRLTALPLAWAIRGEVLSNNTGNIDTFMEKLVREKAVKRIVFVDAAGKVVSSTNLKLKDQLAATALPGIDLTATQPRVEPVGSDLRIVVPVMSFDRQIGTLVLDYMSPR